MRIGEISRAAFDLYYVVTKKNSGRQVASAKTAIVFYDYATRRTVAMPKAFRTAIETAGIQK